MNPYREWYLAMHELLALADTVGVDQETHQRAKQRLAAAEAACEALEQEAAERRHHPFFTRVFNPTTCHCSQIIGTTSPWSSEYVHQSTGVIWCPSGAGVAAPQQ